MEQHQNPTPPPAPTTAPGIPQPQPVPPHPASAPPPGRARWTPAKQRIFLAALLETGSVARAARAAGMSRSSAHRLRGRLAGTAFDRTWDHVLALHARRMADPFAPEALPVTTAPSPRTTTAHRPPPVAQQARR